MEKVGLGGVTSRYRSPGLATPVVWIPVLAVAATLAEAAGSFGGWYACMSAHHDSSASCRGLGLGDELFHIGAGLAFMAAALVAWMRPHRRRLALLMGVEAAAWFIVDLEWIGAPLPFTFSQFAWGLGQPVFGHLLLAFPTGRLRSNLERGFVGAGYTAWLFSRVMSMVWFRPGPGLPANLLMIADDPARNAVGNALGNLMGLAFTAVFIGLMALKWRHASGVRRRDLSVMFLATSLVIVVTLAFTLLGRGFLERQGLASLASLGLASVPLGFLLGQVRPRQEGAVSGRLLIDLGGPPPRERLERVLAEMVRDPSLRLGHWNQELSRFIDANGEEVVPPREGDERVATFLCQSGRTVGVLTHGPALSPDLIRSAIVATPTRIRGESVVAELSAELGSVRASRSRIVEAIEDERQRLERALSRGPEEKLATALTTLELVRMGMDAGPEAGERLDLLLGLAREALAELHELGQGIHPRQLTTGGLAPALGSLVERSTVPATLAEVPATRFPGAVEAAAYFLIAEALTNATKHGRCTAVTVAVREDEQHLCIEVEDDGVGGAQLKGGSGLSGLVDRVTALDGRVQIVSPPGKGTKVSAEIPIRGYRLLGEADQALIRRLVVMPAGFDLEAARAVGAYIPVPADDFEHRVTRLVDQSLIRIDPGAQGGRYRLAETLDSSARQGLVESEEEGLIRARHAQHFLGLVQSAGDQLTGPQTGAWLDRLDADHENLLSALDWSRAAGHRPSPALVNALARFWFLRDHYVVGRRTLASILQSEAAPTPLRARTLQGLAALAWRQGDYLYANSCLTEAVRILRESDSEWLPTGLNWLGRVADSQGRHHKAETLFMEQMAIGRRRHDDAVVASAHFNLGIVATSLLDLAAARAHIRDYLTFAQDVGSPVEIASGYWWLAYIALDRGDLTAVRDLQERSIDIRLRLGDWSDLGTNLDLAARAAVAANRPDRALQLAGAAASLRATTRTRVSPARLVKLESALARARGAVRDRADGFFTEGTSLTPEEAAALALLD